MTTTSLSHLHINGERTPLRIREAVKWWSRAVGLLATPKLEDPCGLWIKPCNSVHTVGMRYPIDVIFVNKDGTIARIVDRMPPWRAAGCRKAKSTLELRAGLAQALSLRPGMMVELREAQCEASPTGWSGVPSDAQPSRLLKYPKRDAA